MDRLRKWMMVLMPLAVVTIVLYIEDNALTHSSHMITSPELPEAFDGYRIVHLSDLHSKWFGEDQSRLVDQVNDQEPDLIVFTGDLIDRNRNDLEAGVTLLERLKQTAPVYYVTGNHEWDSGKAEALIDHLNNRGIRVLQDDLEKIERKDETLTVIGIDDPDKRPGEATVRMDTLDRLIQEAEPGFTILLSHRPEYFDSYQQRPIDLVFSGHAHGGQFRLPFIGGLIAPGQGLFPKYEAGKHDKNGTTLVVSRGLGNSIFPQRLFNRPEIVTVTLKDVG